MSDLSRPSWDEVWFEVADIVSVRSLCDRAEIGCVIVDAQNKVQAATYNGPSPAFDHRNETCSSWCPRTQTGDTSQSYDLCPANHAEANAIARSDYSKLEGATMYVNGSVCATCAKLIATTGITRVVHRVTPEMAYRKPEDVERYLRQMGVTVDRR